MFTTTNLILGTTIAIVGYALDSNRANIWKLTHKNMYHRLTSRSCWNGVNGKYDNWVCLYAWEKNEEELNREYNHTMERLFRDEDYQKAPFEIQVEAEERIYKTYLYSKKLAEIDEN